MFECEFGVCLFTLNLCVCCFVFLTLALFQVVYHALQLVAFTAMAMLIMRLKLFWTPQLCVVSALLASRRVSVHWMLVLQNIKYMHSETVL
jgi:hypothetical protein